MEETVRSIKSPALSVTNPHEEDEDVSDDDLASIDQSCIME